MPTIFKAALMTAALMLTDCATTTIQDTARTELVLCRIWGDSLPTRSRQDTQLTQDGIAAAYADFEAACPDFGHLVP